MSLIKPVWGEITKRRVRSIKPRIRTHDSLVLVLSAAFTQTDALNFSFRHFLKLFLIKSDKAAISSYPPSFQVSGKIEEKEYIKTQKGIIAVRNSFFSFHWQFVCVRAWVLGGLHVRVSTCVLGVYCVSVWVFLWACLCVTLCLEEKDMTSTHVDVGNIEM